MLSHVTFRTSTHHAHIKDNESEDKGKQIHMKMLIQEYLYAVATRTYVPFMCSSSKAVTPRLQLRFYINIHVTCPTTYITVCK